MSGSKQITSQYYYMSQPIKSTMINECVTYDMNI